MATVKKDLVIYKATGKIHMVRDCMVEKDNIISILDGHTHPTFANSPFHDPYKGKFFNDGNYQLVKGVEIEEEIIGKHMQYRYDVATEQIERIALYNGMGFAHAIMKLQEAAKTTGK